MLLIFTRLCQFKLDIIVMFPALLHPSHQGQSTITSKSKCSLCLSKLWTCYSTSVNPLRFVPSRGEMCKMVQEDQQVVAWAKKWMHQAGSLHSGSCLGKCLVLSPGTLGLFPNQGAPFPCLPYVWPQSSSQPGLASPVALPPPRTLDIFGVCTCAVRRFETSL